MNRTILIYNGDKLVNKLFVYDAGYFHMRYNMMSPGGVCSVIPKSKFLRIINEAREKGYTIKEA